MYNILVVDDENIICSGMRDALESMGEFTVYMASNGKEALHIIQSGTIHAMLLDIAMPDMNGIELMKALAGNDEKPITFIISGYEEFDYVKVAMNYGAIDYVLKPIDSDDVIGMGRRIMTILAERQQEQTRIDATRKFVLNNRGTIKQKLLYDIINNRSVTIDLEDIKSIYGIDLSGEYYCVAVFHAKKGSNGVGEVDYQVALKIVEEIIEEEISDTKGEYLFNMENARYVLLFSSREPFEKGYIAGLLSLLMERIGRVNNTECAIGKGTEVHGLYNISSSYDNANDALYYRQMFGAGLVYDIGDYRQNAEIQALSEMTREIEKCLSFMQYNEAKEQLEVYFDYIERHAAQISPAQLSFFTVKCIIAFLTVLYENGEDVVDMIFEGMLLPTWDSPAQIRARVMRISDRTMEQITAGYSQKQKMIVHLVKKNIEEFYTDNELSVNWLSSKLHYSANYIGNLFKHEFNMTINDFINKVRIENAKRLMKEKGLKLYEVAYRVGFSDQHYFSKVFKKYENVTPKEYDATY